MGLAGGKSREAWVEELPTILWLYLTTSRSSTGETPFSLTYDIEAIVPLEIISTSLRVTEFDANTTKAEQHQDLDVLDEKHEASQLHHEDYKAYTENYYNQSVQVKKSSRWENGYFTRTSPATHSPKAN